MQIWKPVTGYEGLYEVSNAGDVRRCGNDALGRKRYIGRLLYKATIRGGYLRVILHGKAKKTYTIHRLVADAFIGPRPEGCGVNHKNGNKTDNRPQNLEYCTQEENNRHAREVLGVRPPKGKNHWKAIFNDADILRMRRMRKRGIRVKEIATEYGISMGYASVITRGLVWKHVPMS